MGCDEALATKCSEQDCTAGNTQVNHRTESTFLIKGEGNGGVSDGGIRNHQRTRRQYGPYDHTFPCKVPLLSNGYN